MKSSDVRNIPQLIAGKLGWPVLMGATLTILLYLAIHIGLIPEHSLLRYLTAHPVEYVEVGMFMVGVSALLLKAGRLFGEFGALSRIELPRPATDRTPISHVPLLIEAVGSLPSAIENSLLGQRIVRGLSFIQSSQSASGLGDELKYLADVDRERCEHDYSLVRIVIWATPMLGFLGTVIGITLALGNLSPEALVNEPKVAMESLLQGLSVAFDTTALALTLSIALMFGQFLLSRIEAEVLEGVDRIAEEQLAGRFETEGSSTDPNIQVVRRMSERTIQATQDLVVRQTELWRETISAAHQHWQNVNASTAEQLETALETALGRALADYGKAQAESQHHQAEHAARQITPVVQSLTEVSAALREQHSQLAEQSGVLLRVLEATGEVAGLEDALNRNLSALAGKQHFEETVQNLAATIHLLNSRFNPGASPAVHLDRKSEKGQAA